MFNNTNKKKIADINVTPLVDVTMVLLIIFMITAPMLNHGISVNLPVVEGTKLDDSQKPVVLSIKANKELYLNDTKIDLASLKSRLEFVYKNKDSKEIFIKADKELNYGYVASIINASKKAGIKKIGLVTLTDEK